MRRVGLLLSRSSAAMATAQRTRLFTPGPLNTSEAVRRSMLVDYGSRDQKFIDIIKKVRQNVLLGGNLPADSADYTCVPMQGSGSMGIEAIVTSTTPPDGRWLVIINGKYGERLEAICGRLNIKVATHKTPENSPPDMESLEAILVREGSAFTNIGVVHCETTTGIMNPIPDIAALCKKHAPQASLFVDSMSCYGAAECDVAGWDLDFVITSSNKCIQGVPGFSVVIAKKEKLLACAGWARSYTLSLLEQFNALEKSGQFPNTPPVHSIVAYNTALEEWLEEGGWRGREKRYKDNMQVILYGFRQLGFVTYLDPTKPTWGHIILTFLQPTHPNWNFEAFYRLLAERGFVIYPGKLTERECFRIGCIGDLFEKDMQDLVEATKEVLTEMKVEHPIPADLAQ